MSAAGRELVEALRTRGLLRATDAPDAAAEDAGRPWFISLLLGVAGWLAGIFVLVFLGILLSPDSSRAVGLMGLVQLGGALALYHANRRAVFLEQIALAFSIGGQIAMAWVFFDVLKEPLPVVIALCVLQLVIFVVMPNKVARTLATLFAVIAWAYAVRFALRPGSGEGAFFDVEGNVNLPMLGQWTLPVEWLLTWAPLVALAWWLVRGESRWMAGRARAFARPALTGVLLALCGGGVITEPFALLALGIEAIGLPVSWWALFPLLSIALAMFAAYCAHQVRSAGLVGVALLGGLVHLARFYHLYGTTLLWKSLLMLCAGAALLGVATLLSRRTPESGL